jgi:hypothetical protein
MFVVLQKPERRKLVSSISDVLFHVYTAKGRSTVRNTYYSRLAIGCNLAPHFLSLSIYIYLSNTLQSLPLWPRVAPRPVALTFPLARVHRITGPRPRLWRKAVATRMIKMKMVGTVSTTVQLPAV